MRIDVQHYQHIKVERVLLALYTDKDGRRLVGGIGIDQGRDWVDVFNDCAKEITESGQVVDIVEYLRDGRTEDGKKALS